MAYTKKEFKLIRELEKEVIKVFGSLNIFSEDDLSLIFSCAYGIGENERKILEDKNLTNPLIELSEKAEHIYREEYEMVTSKLDDLQARGIQF